MLYIFAGNLTGQAAHYSNLQNSFMAEDILHTKKLNILIIDDDNKINSVLSQILSEEFDVYTTTSVIEGLEIARQTSPFLAMVDLMMPKANGVQVLKEIKKINPCIRVMIMSAYGEVDSVVEIFKEGAMDFLAKPFNFNDLLHNIRHLASVSVMERHETESSKEIIGNSYAINKVWSLVKRFAPCDIPVLIQGETGTGKELFARVIHDLSLRRKGPFIPVDCSALPESLIESELFGYEKGAFTGAITSKKGLFEAADEGTLFIDEIGNLPLHIQTKLLRIIQDHTVIRLGARGYEPVSINMRIVAATNVDLRAEAEKGRFRLDLYYRLNVASIILPPLRERPGDIPLLVNYYLDKCNNEFQKTIGITDDAMDLLNNYQWPGNIRELENVIRSAFLISDDRIHPSNLTKILNNGIKPTLADNIVYSDDFIDIKSLKNSAGEEAEKEAILNIMRNNPTMTRGRLARILRIDPKTLRSKLKKFGLDSIY